MKKMRWFGKLCCAFATMALASLSVMGCDLEVDDKDNRAALVSNSGNSGDSGTGTGSSASEDNDNNDNNNSTSVLYVGLGGENTFNISSVKVGDTAQTIKHATLTPSAWNAISEFETVQVPNGSSVSYTFTQAEAGADNWKTWSIAVYDNATVSSANGNLLRGDNWLNKSTLAGFAAGLWSDGDVTAGGTYSNNFTYETAGKSLTSSNTVVVKVEYSGSTVTITETVDGQLAYTTTGTISSSSASSSEDDNTTTDNTTTDNTNTDSTTTDNTNTENENGENGNGGTAVTVPTAVYTAKLDGTDSGVSIVGAGSYVSDTTFTKVFKNDGSAQRTSYLLLPDDTLQHSATSKEMTIGFWVNANGDDTVWLPMFAAYAAAPSSGTNTFPMFMCQSRCKVQVNCAGYCDFTLDYLDATATSSKYDSSDVNIGYSGWKDSNWHYYTCVLTTTTATIYIDGELIAKWNVDGTSEGQTISGMFTSTELKYVCLGGNQAWDWADNDAPYSFAKFSVWDSALTVDQIKAVIAAK